MWAVATRLFKTMSAYWTAAALALIKSWVSLLMFGFWFLLSGTPLLDQSFEVIAWLFFSGVIGIAIGDTALFLALYRMGERQTLLVSETVAPVAVLVSAFALLGESMAVSQLAGILLVILGVDWVIGFRRGTTHFDARGVGWALLAAACQSFGVLISRLYLTETDISAEATAFWRIAGASIALPLWLLIRGESLIPEMPPTARVHGRLFIGILLGTFLGIWFLQISIDRLPAGIAQTLIATSILFAVVFSALRGERVEVRQWGGVMVALAGVALISYRFAG